MRSIIDTLNVIKNAVTKFEKKTKKDAFIALIGGYAVIFHGIERTTLDVDACFYSLTEEPGRDFHAFLRENLPKRFKLRFIEASKDISDPLRHDIIIIDDKKKEYPRTDILVANYKWELDGLKRAKKVGKLGIPVMPLPHLLVMKLQAGGRKDDLDVVEMLKIMSEKAIEESKELAKTAGRDRKFQALLKEVG